MFRTGIWARFQLGWLSAICPALRFCNLARVTSGWKISDEEGAIAESLHPESSYVGFDASAIGHEPRFISRAAIAKYQIDCTTTPPSTTCADMPDGIANIATSMEIAAVRPNAPTARRNPGALAITQDQLSTATA